MKKNKKKLFVRAVLLMGVLFASSNTFAAQGIIPDCKMLPLANNPIITGVANTTVCVDIPVSLTENHTVFNLDSLATTDGTAAGAPVGIRHMWMFGKAMQARVAHGLMKPEDIQIIGVIHGSALGWALNDAWWQSQVDEDGHQLYPNGNPYKDWIEKLFALNNAGLNVQLEVCGVTLSGKGLTRDNVYSSDNGRIFVNQGAIGRLVDLQQKGYKYIQEGWVDNDKKKHDD